MSPEFLITNVTVRRSYKPEDYAVREITLVANVDQTADVDTVIARIAFLAEKHAKATPVDPTRRAVETVSTAVSSLPSVEPEAVGGRVPVDLREPEDAPVSPPDGMVLFPSDLPDFDEEPALSHTDVFPEEEPAPVISNQDLGKVANDASSRLRKSQDHITALHKLIDKFCEGQKKSGLHSIPQERRAAFVAEAKKLK